MILMCLAKFNLAELFLLIIQTTDLTIDGR